MDKEGLIYREEALMTLTGEISNEMTIEDFISRTIKRLNNLPSYDTEDKKLILEKKVDGEWWFEGEWDYSSVKGLVSAVFVLGRCASVVEDVRLLVMDKGEKYERP